METVNCNLCGSRLAKPMYAVADLHLGNLLERFQYVSCMVCGLVYQNPRPSPDEIQQYYPEDYASYHPVMGTGKSIGIIQRAQWYGMTRRCHEILKYKNSGVLLDIGCADGSFLQVMQKYPGWRVEGVETSEYAAKLARQAGISVFTGSLAEAQFADQAFDVITLWDVLEHLPDPTGTLVEIRRLLKPDGILLARIPNGASWEARWFGQHWSGVDAPRHFYIFTLITIRKMLEKTGFHWLGLHSRIGSYSSFVISLRFWMTARGISMRRANTYQRWLSHPIARLLFTPLFSLSSLARRGPALIVAARPH